MSKVQTSNYNETLKLSIVRLIDRGGQARRKQCFYRFGLGHSNPRALTHVHGHVRKRGEIEALKQPRKYEVRHLQRIPRSRTRSSPQPERHPPELPSQTTSQSSIASCGTMKGTTGYRRMHSLTTAWSCFYYNVASVILTGEEFLIHLLHHDIDEVRIFAGGERSSPHMFVDPALKNHVRSVGNFLHGPDKPFDVQPVKYPERERVRRAKLSGQRHEILKRLSQNHGILVVEPVFHGVLFHREVHLRDPNVFPLVELCGGEKLDDDHFPHLSPKRAVGEGQRGVVVAEVYAGAYVRAAGEGLVVGGEAVLHGFPAADDEDTWQAEADDENRADFVGHGRQSLDQMSFFAEFVKVAEDRQTAGRLRREFLGLVFGPFSQGKVEERKDEKP
nr:hypothetical protein MIMGU_mgv1a009963mg [Ipomoea batatas]